MKGKLKFFVIFLIFLIVIISQFSRNDEFRVRVISSSNSEDDIALKEEIASNITDFILLNNINKNNVEEYFDDIESIVQKYNVDYKMEVKDEFFPAKEVNDYFSPEGYYSALVITIGEGNGKNYFSILYPEYYNTNYEEIKTKEVTFKFFIIEKLKELFK